MNIKRPKRIETSKLILIVSYAMAVALTAIVVYGSFAYLDMSSVVQIALAAWAEVAATNVWYYKKAGRENALKIYKSLPQEIKDQVDINQIINHE
jgi:hypothetical protein